MTTVVVAVCAQKGGVGKTSLTLGYAACAAGRGRTVLVVDLDPQANATFALLPDPPGSLPTVYDLLHTRPEVGAAAGAVIPTDWEGVDLLPADRHLAAVESDGTLAVEQRLRRALAGVVDGYDLVLLDCPPSLGRLAVGGLVAASHALVITEPGLAALHGVQETLDTVDTVRDAYSPALGLAGVVPNRVEPRLTEQAARLAELRDSLGELVWSPVPKRAALAAAYGAGLPVTGYPGMPGDLLAVLADHTDRLLQLTPPTGK